MIDAQGVVRAFVAGRPGVSAVAGGRVYAEVDLPEQYAIADGPAVLLGIRGGAPSYDDNHLETSVQMRCYGATQTEAWRMYRALYDAVHGKSGTGVQRARCAVVGQLVRDPETMFYYVITFFTFWLHNRQA